MVSIWDRSTVPDAAPELIATIEGLRLEPYLDTSKVWTIGIGATFDGNGRRVTKDTPRITEAEAYRLMKRDMAIAVPRVAGGITAKIDVRAAAALVSAAYNLGALKVAAPRLCQAVNRQDPDAPNMLRWYRMSGGRPSLGLIRRRWAEAGLWLGLSVREAYRRAWSEIKQLEDWPTLPSGS